MDTGWTMGLSDATAGEQFYQIAGSAEQRVPAFGFGQYNNGQSSTNNQTVIQRGGNGRCVLNGSNNAGNGRGEFRERRSDAATVATIRQRRKCAVQRDAAGGRDVAVDGNT